ncbi:MAG: aldehyde-activating protein [Myxococcales bacterium 68-20]|nr:GFA family protein [Myxococcales bacterium]OJY18488.1 MAG: aldehyde-activating protein [Myxococcales bacterium 68-20]
MSKKTYTGGCHCGNVRYEADIDLSQGTGKCNCSICSKVGRHGAIIKPDAFRLLSGEESLSNYQFNSKTGHHLFCKTCGIHAFGRGDLPGILDEYVSINLNCLDDAEADVKAAPIKHFNGRDNDWS